MTKNNNDLDSLHLFAPEVKSIRNYKQVIPVTIYHYYVTDEIEDIEMYIDLINTLKTAEPHDTVFIYLNTPGGDMSIAIQIISAIKQCQGTVVTALEGNVCSAGTLIFLSGHKFLINPNCTFMIHDYSQWVGGKGNEIHLQVNYYKEYFRKLANDIYGNFLTENEIESVLAGKDIWMDSDEVLRRLKEDVVNIQPNELIDNSIPVPPKKTKPAKTTKKKIKKK